MEDTHKTYIQVQGQFFVAACDTCAESGTSATANFSTRESIEDAEADATAHGELEWLAPRESLIAQVEAEKERLAHGPPDQAVDGKEIPV